MKPRDIPSKPVGGNDRDAIVQTLRRGGPDAVTLFLRVSMGLHEFGGLPAVNGWLEVALPALPETERCALVGILIDTLAENFDFEFRDETMQ